MLLAIVAVIVGFILMAWGAERFVRGASSLARSLGVSPLIIGLTIVGFGTSAPEMLVSGIASWDGKPLLAVGNAIGSNITNIALVLGLTALAQPLMVGSGILRRELPVLLVTMFIGLALLLDGLLGRIDGIILAIGMVIFIVWVVRLGMNQRQTDVIEKEIVDELEQLPPMTIGRSLAILTLGMVVMFASSRLLVWGCVEIARFWGLSELVIGLTVVAIGTSLPELAASLVSARKGEYDIALGNVIGSNMFNLLGVMALPGLLSPVAIGDDILFRDFPLMLGLTLALFVMAFGFRGQGRISRFEGGLLLTAYFAYLYVLYLSSVVP